MSFLKYGRLCFLLLFLVACGGGGGSGSGVSSGPVVSSAPVVSGFQQTYTSSAAIGELITYAVDTQNMTYSFVVIKSQYGCELVNSPCRTGNGSLVKNADGSYTPSGSPTSKIYALKSGLLVGTIKLGAMPATPLIGIPNPITTAAGLAGIYNYISVQCPAKSNGNMNGCHSYYGTVSVSATGNSVTYSTCQSDDISNPARNCVAVGSGSGSVDADGRWTFLRTGSANENYMVAFVAANGQKVAYIDFNDPGAGGYGYGQATMSEKVRLQVAGYAANAGDWYVTSLTPGSDSTTIKTTSYADGSVSSGGTMTLNTPWDGFLTNSTDASGKFIISGGGVFTHGGWTDNQGRAKDMLGIRMN
jgi:hypothetical protein